MGTLLRTQGLVGYRTMEETFSLGRRCIQIPALEKRNGEIWKGQPGIRTMDRAEGSCVLA